MSFTALDLCTSAAHSLRDMDMNGAALLADAGGNEFRDIVQRHHARAEGAPLTRSELEAGGGHWRAGYVVSSK